jgi:hypothetical protein
MIYIIYIRTKRAQIHQDMVVPLTKLPIVAIGKSASSCQSPKLSGDALLAHQPLEIGLAKWDYGSSSALRQFARLEVHIQVGINQSLANYS